MKMLTIARKNFLGLLRDPLSLGFGLGFPLVLLFLLSAIQANVPVPLFVIETLTPGMMVFGLSFLALSAAVTLSRDRQSSLLQRLYTTPLKPSDFILGYFLPLLPAALLQGLICIGAAFLLGLAPSLSLLPALLFLLVPAVFFISFGLLFGCFLTDKQAGGICGALLTNLTAWLSGTWFDLALVGGAFERIAKFLPFYHAVEMERLLFVGELSKIVPHLLIVLAYACASVTLSIILFLRQMKNDK